MSDAAALVSAARRTQNTSDGIIKPKGPLGLSAVFVTRPCQMVPSALCSIYLRPLKEAPPTRAERLGHQPRQAAGNLGSGEVIVVEALDGGDDEGPSHPPVICRISHLQPCGAPLCSWRFTQPREFLLTDDIPHEGIQRSSGGKKSLL